MEIFNEGNYLYKPFGCMDEEELLTRLVKFNDITSITTIYEDGSEDTRRQE